MSYFILSILIILIIATPVAIGSVYIIAFSAMEVVIFSLLLLQLWTGGIGAMKPAVEKTGEGMSPSDGIVHPKYLFRTFLLMVPILLFLVVGFFQLVPLPMGMVRIISPGIAGLYEKLGVSSGFHPLTLSVYATTATLLKWSAYAAVFLLVAAFHPRGHRLSRGRWITILLFAIFAVAFFEAIYGLYLALNRSDSILWFTRASGVGAVAGTWINPDHLAGYMNMAILCTLGLFASYAGIRRRRDHGVGEAVIRFASSGRALLFWILGFGLAVMILATTFSLSRMGHVSLFTGLLFMITLYLFRRLNTLTVILMVVVGLAVLWVMWKGLEPVVAKWSNVHNALYADRLQIWKGTLGLVSTYPILGTGPGTFELAFPPFKPATFGITVYDHAHNDYLEVLSETGIAGFVTWVVFFLAFIYSATKAWFRRHDVFARGIGAGGIAATVTIMVHSLADFNLQIPANALLLFVVMGITWRALHTSFQ